MGWNPLGSKTKYYVSSSTFPIFNDTTRLNSYEAGILDYTSNSSIEQYEYFKNYYNTSRLRDIRGYINWADSSGFSGTMGKVTTTFYGDASIDNDIITSALRNIITAQSNQVIQAYSSILNIFSEDFWLKYLATQQGVAYLFFEGTGVDYTVSFPDDNHIKATFTNGKVVEGRLPTNANKYRWLEICYSIETTSTTTKKDENGNDEIDPDTNLPIQVTEITYTYGYYHYREASGNAQLDSVIENNGIHGTQSFYPVIPIRTDTHWFGGTQAYHIGNALKHLHLYNPTKGPRDCYNELINGLTEGINKGGQGSLSDIDYMTIILGPTITTRNQSDLHYIFEFFYNLYVNYKLTQGLTPELKSGGLSLFSGQGNLQNYFETLFTKLGFSREYSVSTATVNSRSTRGIFSKIWKKLGFGKGFSQFTISNPSSNLNLTYDWGHAEYFEANGKFKSNAKIGEYGVLAGLQRHDYAIWEVVTDAEGNPVTHYNEDTGRNETEYELNEYTNYINYVLFCKQTSENRWKFVMFSGLTLINLVYHGKTVETDAYDAVKDSNQTTVLQHSFEGDRKDEYDEYTLFSFHYVENTGEDPSAFIVPLEQNTFYEIGVPDQMNISYGCEYLICNCWEKKKVRWYQRGWLSVFIAFTASVITSVFAPIISNIFFTIGIVLLTAQMMELTQKILCVIFGEALGTKIYNFVVQLVKTILLVVASICFKIPVIGWIIWAICIAIYTTIAVAQYLRAGYSLEQAFKKGITEGAIAGVTSFAAGSLGAAAGGAGAAAGGGASAAGGAAAGAGASSLSAFSVSGALSYTGAALNTANGLATASFAVGSNTALQSMSQGTSVGKALGQGVIAGGAMYAGGVAGQYIGGALGGTGSTLGAYAGAFTQGAVSGFISGFGNALLNGDNFRTALKQGGIQAAVGGGMGIARTGFTQLSKAMGWGKYGLTPAELEQRGEWDLTSPDTNAQGNHTGLQGTIDKLNTAQQANMSTGQAFAKYGGELFKNIMSDVVWPYVSEVMTNPMTYGNLLVQAYADQQYHKMANMLNDYEEFNNKYKAAEKVLNMLNQMNNSTVTAEFVCFMQSILGRMQYQFSDMASMDPESWLSLATTSGHDQLKTVLAGPSTFVDAKLTVDGYEPYQLFYTQMDFDLTFTETSTTL